MHNGFLNSFGLKDPTAVAPSNLLATYMSYQTMSYSNWSSQINSNYLSINMNP